ncbi:glutathione S-transferase family protein [Rhodobaculum claviforme]|uniref:Glutathione S-transferase n=1 Tax=Rhodobaculum claviforme TaxID=1549854 RepID=A0A934WEE9_9RHOB|nr:glutathione S-transferase family protein [Rhodobaculum claviforme]MBK5926145.1 glutathione S-transferase [Rhodobaculum claviforme]
MYTVIGGVRSRAARVLWMLEELGQPYEHLSAAPQSAEVARLNPAGKVPVLVDDGTAITDSTAIIQYLADRHGALTHPAGTLERARQDSLTQFVLDEFDSVLWVAARHSFILPEALRHEGIKESLTWEFTRSQATLVERLGAGPFLMGDTMTVPDIVLTHCGVWARAARFPISEPAWEAYLERMVARPAFRRAMAR